MFRGMDKQTILQLSKVPLIKYAGIYPDGRNLLIPFQYAGCKIIFFDAGTYIVTDTITIPAGTQVVGEAWSVIMGSGNNFFDFNNPRVVVKVGETGSSGVVEITDMIFTTRGPGA